MLRLTLIRHAKTEPARSGQEDWDRVLEARGKHDAPEMGRRLKARDLKPDKMISSPAARAIATAKLIARELGIAASKIQQEERLYLASPKEILAVVHEHGQRAQHLMLVGHNPGFTEFADRVSSERDLDNLPTCAVYTLEFEIESWSELDWGTGINAELDYPKRSA
jgi:phosphohistidine phosphatase